MRYTFRKIRLGLRSLIREEEGQPLVEYALVIALLCCAAVASMVNCGSALRNYYQYIVTHLGW